MSRNALRLFISYSHEDDNIRRELAPHLSPLKRQGIIVDWTDRCISPGTPWEQEISSELERADLIILLISSDFIDSEYCYGKEMARALARHEVGTARVIPVIGRACHWQGLPFAKLQALPSDGDPITMWPNRDSAYLSVVQGIENAAREHLQQSSTIVSDWVGSLFARRKVVRTVQGFLKERGWYGGPIDGEPANLHLREAVRKFQKSISIDAYGLIGPQTLRAINKELGKGDSNV